MGIKSSIPSLNKQIVFENGSKINVNMKKINYSSSKNYNANKYMDGNGSSTSKSTTYNGEDPNIRKNFYTVKSQPLKFSLDGKETFLVADLMRGTTTTSDGKKVSLAGNEVITDLRNRIAKKHNPSNSGEWWKYTTDADFEKYLYEEIGLDLNDRTKILAEFKSQYGSQIENMTDDQIWEYIVYSKMQESYIIEQNMKEYNARAEKFENFENQLIRDVKINYIYQDYLGIEVKLDSEGNVTNSDEILNKYYEFIGRDKGTVCDEYSKLWNEAKTPAEKEQVFASACMYEFNCKMEEIDNKNFEDSLTRLDKFGRWGLKQRESFKFMKNSFKYAIESPDVTLVDGAALFFDKMADGYMSFGGEISCALGRFVVEDIMGEKYDAELWKETVAEQVNAVNEGNLADEIMNVRMKKDARFAVESDYMNKYYAAREFGSNMYTMAATIAAPGAAGLSMSILESTGASYGIAVSEGASSTDAMDYATVRGITEGTTQYLLYRAMGSAGSTEVTIAGKTFSKYGFDLATNLGFAALDPVADAITKKATYRHDDDIKLIDLMKEEDTLGRSFTGVVSSYGFMKAGEFAKWGITKIGRTNTKYKIASNLEDRKKLGIPDNLSSKEALERINKIYKNLEYSNFETRALDLETLKKLSDSLDGLDPRVQKDILEGMTGTKKISKVKNTGQFDGVMDEFIKNLTPEELIKFNSMYKSTLEQYMASKLSFDGVDVSELQLEDLYKLYKSNKVIDDYIAASPKGKKQIISAVENDITIKDVFDDDITVKDITITMKEPLDNDITVKDITITMKDPLGDTPPIDNQLGDTVPMVLPIDETLTEKVPLMVELGPTKNSRDIKTIEEYKKLVYSGKYSKTIDGIKFFSETEFGMNQLIEYYKGVKNINTASSNYFLEIIQKKGAVITDIHVNDDMRSFCSCIGIVYFDNEILTNNVHSAFFHEFGHFLDIDSNLSQRRNFDRLIDFLRNGYDTLGLEEKSLKLSADIERYGEILDAQLENNYDRDIERLYKKLCDEIDGYSSCTPEKQREILEYYYDDYTERYRDAGLYECGLTSISDIYDALTKGKFYDVSGWGHGVEYFSDDLNAYLEIIANTSDLYNSGKIKMLDDYFPPIVKTYLTDCYEMLIGVSDIKEKLNFSEYMGYSKYGEGSITKSLLEYLRTGDSSIISEKNNLRKTVESFSEASIKKYLSSFDLSEGFLKYTENMLDSQYGTGVFKEQLGKYAMSGSIDYLPNDTYIRDYISCIDRNQIFAFLNE